jgi:putative flippase GtrA
LYKPRVSDSPRPPLLKRLTSSWALRSVALGGVSTAVDLSVGATLRHFGLATHLAAMCGTSLGAIFTYVSNRKLAFKDHQQGVVRSAVKFIVMTITLSTIHGQITAWLCDTRGLPYPVAKMSADLLVFTFNQPLLLRYFVFPKAKP